MAVDQRLMSLASQEPFNLLNRDGKACNGAAGLKEEILRERTAASVVLIVRRRRNSKI